MGGLAEKDSHLRPAEAGVGTEHGNIPFFPTWGKLTTPNMANIKEVFIFFIT